MVKRGFRSAPEPRICGISFESLPAWLWAFRLSDWSSILITDSDEAKLRQYHESTWTHVQSKLIIVQVSRLTSASVTAAIWFGCGHPSHANELAAVIDVTVPICFWVMKASRGLPKNTPSCWEWVGIDHSRMGGSTTIRGVFGFSKMKAPKLRCDPIRRSIAHILKYSERPNPCSPTWTIPHYTIHDQLSVHCLTRPVLFATAFSFTGWGQRQLIGSELSQAFDLPLFVPWSDSFPCQLVPIQLFRIAIDAVLTNLAEDDPTTRSQRPRLLESSPVAGSIIELDRTWLSSLNVWLPGEWANIAIADRAVKSDLAEVNFAPWNRRISLVMVSTPQSIAAFESFGLRYWRRTLMRSFLSYLHRRYGGRWADHLVHRRAIGSITGGKRRRTTSVSVLHPLSAGGGLVLVGGNEIDKLDELEKDVTKGCLILAQVLRSEWWEWSFGSALFFWRWNGDEQRRAARDGMRIFVQAPLPQGRKEAVIKLDDRQLGLVAGKLDVMLRRSYLEAGFVRNTVPFFSVPKGDDDIRVVFDGTSCGLNETLWSPNFFLPTARSAALHLTTSDLDG